MKSIWFYYTLTLCSLFQLVSCYLFQPPHVPAQYLIASKPRHAGQFVQLENISQTKSPVAYLRPSFKSLTIPFPKVSSEPSLVPDSTPNPVSVYSETPIKKPKAKTTRTTRISGKNDIKDFIKEMDAEKEHEKKLSDILPLVTFDCHDISEGYYADVAFQCEVFHYCGKPSGKRFTFFCPPGSRFNQMHLICDYEMFQGCDKSHEYFHLNDKMHPKDDKNVSSTKTHYHQINTTSIPPSHFTYKSVSTTPRQISAVTLKSNLIEVKETSYKRPDRSRYSQRQWTMAYPHGPMVMRVPSRMGKLQPATNHIPTSRVLLNPHYIPMIRNKKTNIAAPNIPRREIPLRSHLMSNRRHSHLQYFPPAHQFRRRPLPPPDMVFEYDEPPLESRGVPRLPMDHKIKPQNNWKSTEDDWKAEDEKPIEASKRSGQATRRVPTKDKWDELDKAVAHWKLAGKRGQQNTVKATSETEESESESSEEEVTTQASRRKVSKPKTTTSFSVVATTAKTTTRRPIAKYRVKTSSIGGRINNRRSTTTMSSSKTRSTAASITSVTSSSIGSSPIDMNAFTEPVAQTTEVTHIFPKHKHRFTNVQRTRLKTSTFPTPYSPSVSFAITIKPVTSGTSTFETIIEDTPVAAAFVNTEDNGLFKS